MGVSLKETALTYLKKDGLSNAGMIEVIQRNSADIIIATTKGVLLKDTDSDVFMISFDESEAAIKELQKLDDFKIVQSSDRCVYEWILKHTKLKDGMECFQAVYDKLEELPYNERLQIRKIKKEEEFIVQNNYKKLSKEELHEICNRGNLYVGILDGQMIGFIGNHLEGSIGLLEVFSDYRRQGFAKELMSFMINRALHNQTIPYGQVECDNMKSLNLQKKLGLKIASKKLYWNY